MGKRVYEPITLGNRIGRWTVLRVSPERTARGELRYVCRCDCGEEATVRSWGLHTRNSEQCRKCQLNAARATRYGHSHPSLDRDEPCPECHVRHKQGVPHFTVWRAA